MKKESVVEKAHVSVSAVDQTNVVVTDQTIVRAAIHPGIGIARVGDSQDFLIGPELVKSPLMPPNETRDTCGRIKRQAARFRLYGYNAAGEVVSELTPDNAAITWKVSLANTKAQWFKFDMALDIPEAVGSSVNLRNADIVGPARSQLAITPKEAYIVGKNSVGQDGSTMKGTFKGVDVFLGELRTDEAGRLLVLGGNGVSASPSNKPLLDPNDPSCFNNSLDWYDDVSDGPVNASVRVNDNVIPVDPAWVIVAPPNFAPDILSVRTLYDVIYETHIEAGQLPFPEKVSFTEHILPTLRALSNLQWVNKSFSTMFGRTSPSYDFNDPDVIAKLAQTPDPTGVGDTYEELRRGILHQFHSPYAEYDEKFKWPLIYGDVYATGYVSTRTGLALSEMRYTLFKRWVDGDFVNDLDSNAVAPTTLDDVPLADQPDMLTKAALTFCVADAFHPGCEATWPMRHASLYRAPFRIRMRDANTPAPDYGTTLTPQIALAPGGPLYGQGPGDVTRWMAVPWQGDTARCRSGYDIEFDPYLPTFWPARVPNHVLTEEDYEIVLDTKRSLADRQAAFNRRSFWLRVLLERGEAEVVMAGMVKDFGKMGIVESRPGVENDPNFPAVMFVESLGVNNTSTFANLARSLAKVVPVGALQQAGWKSKEQLQVFRQSFNKNR